MTVSTPRELDALPDGTEIELLDKRGTRRVKVGGHWRAEGRAATQNVYVYVNARRYGAVIKQEEDES
ncbi:hypothetical protein CPT_Spernnie_059 [Streptomyces phage Spernnie]|uniref:Uncharacterized protein n=1 Tax=Streptomyces phage Spernnie TaxID=2767588 RepID=A0A873WH51_9CAUD|nr:hypothetical protein KGG74_gp59 [Streptomyces phage Spernnie]QPB09663.1 hypothetical protein CPT_Spernnie_059 [Streptomyces phage Spernnie]